MSEINEVFTKGLVEELSHRNAETILKGVTVEEARKKPEGVTHSIWEQVYHIWIWKVPFIAAMRGEKVDWEYAKAHNWPSEEEMEEDSAWGRLVANYFKSITDAKDEIMKINLEEKVPAWPKATMAYVAFSLIQHNSYHLGQIVTTKMALGIWKPIDK